MVSSWSILGSFFLLSQEIFRLANFPTDGRVRLLDDSCAPKEHTVTRGSYPANDKRHNHLGTLYIGRHGVDKHRLSFRPARLTQGGKSSPRPSRSRHLTIFHAHIRPESVLRRQARLAGEFLQGWGVQARARDILLHGLHHQHYE